MRRRSTAALLALALVPGGATAQAPRELMPIDLTRSAEHAWLAKPVLARRMLDDLGDTTSWKFSGTATRSYVAGHAGTRAMRFDMQMFVTAPAPNRTRLSSVNLSRAFAGEDWSGFNRLSIWLRRDARGIPALPLQLVLHNDGAVKVPDRYGREGIHYVTVAGEEWQQVVWEIEPLARDRVTRIEIGYWVNKMLAAPDDRVAFEVGALELQKVEPDAHTGWATAPGRIAYSHSGYQRLSTKTAIASGLAARTFDVVDARSGKVVLTKPVTTVRERLGEFGLMDFSSVRTPGTYRVRAGGTTTRDFRIGDDAWKSSIWKTLNFFYGERCGFAVPGIHGVDHLDWFATLGDKRITMSGGWHDAGDLSQGLINTGEATYAMFALAERLRERGEDPALVARLVEEGRWGLAWVIRVRFPGGYRMGFTNHNLWTNNVVGDADDRTREAKNNPNVNYIAAAAGAMAYRVLKAEAPALADSALRIAREDWEYAIVGVEGPVTWHTPAFAASRMELAGIGITASLELYRATHEQRFADKAVELARIVVASQEKHAVGSRFPLSGFFYTGPDRDTIFTQFHRGNDQAAIVALTQLAAQFPAHADWASWYGTVARYAEYQKRGAATTAPYGMLPAYVYRVGDERFIPDSGALHLATRQSYRAQVLSGMPMGEEWYLRAFPVWFARRGNFGLLLSQAKALSAAARLRGDSAGLDLAERQAEWIVGRNPFAQSTMYGEGYDWAQQYSVSSGDFVGSLPVGMQSREDTDLPYWPSANMYVSKEVWVHPSARWLWLMADLLPDHSRPAATRPQATMTYEALPGGEIAIRATMHRAMPVELRGDNLEISSAPRSVGPLVREWRVRAKDPAATWVAALVSSATGRAVADLMSR